MSIIKNFNKFKVNENVDGSLSCKCQSLSGEITLFRLSSQEVVDLNEPGTFYVCEESAVSPDLLKSKGDSLYLITVKTISDNIDIEKSTQECKSHQNDCIVVVKSAAACEIESVVPYK